MKQFEKISSIFIAIASGISLGIFTNSLGFGVIGGLCMFNSLILMAITAENL
jgi:hypothetical protein